MDGTLIHRMSSGPVQAGGRKVTNRPVASISTWWNP
jgi:hypothetical protein